MGGTGRGGRGGGGAGMGNCADQLQEPTRQVLPLLSSALAELINAMSFVHRDQTCGLASYSRFPGGQTYVAHVYKKQREGCRGG